MNFNMNHLNKVILISSIALVGYLANLLLYYVEYNMYSIGYILEIFNFLKPNTGLGFFISFDPRPNFFNHKIYLLDTILGLVFFGGLVQYIITKEKKYNLLAFAFSIVFLSSLINILMYSTIVLMPDLENSTFVFNNFMSSKYFIFNNITWAFFSYYVLKPLVYNTKKLTTLDGRFTKIHHTRYSIYTILDLILALLMFTPLLMLYLGSELHFLETIGLVKVSLVIMIIMSIFLYNILFDTQFGSTPGRFLSMKFLLNKHQKFLDTKNSFLRTYYNISINKKAETSEWQLYKILEIDPKSKMNPYFISSAILIIFSGFIFNYMYNKNHYNIEQAFSEKNKFNFIVTNLNFLDTTTIMELCNKNNSDKLYIKIKDIEEDSFKLDLLTLKDEYIEHAFQIQDIFSKINSDSLYTFKTHKSFFNNKNVGLQYSKLYPCKYNLKFNNINILDSFCIKSVFNFNLPSLFLDGVWVSRELNDKKIIELSIDNFGEEGYITNVKSLIGDIKFAGELPLKLISPKAQMSSPRFKIELENYWNEIKFEFIIVNDISTPNIEQKYIVSGNIYSLKMERVQ